MTRLHAVERGTGPPLVCIHGLGSHHGVWDPVVDRLAERRTVFAVDLPGFGRSAPLPDGTVPTPTALAHAVGDELDARGIERAEAVGNSLGGLVAIHLAAQDRASAVVAISPAGMATPGERLYSRVVLKAVRALATTLRPLAPTLLRPAVTRTLLASWAAARPWRMPADVAIAGAYALADALSFEDALDATPVVVDQDVLDRVRCPVAILWGTRDAVLPQRQLQRWAEALPHARIGRFPRLGHTPMSDAPDAVAAAILEGLEPA